jgi:hypothetical protein
MSITSQKSFVPPQVARGVTGTFENPTITVANGVVTAAKSGTSATSGGTSPSSQGGGTSPLTVSDNAGDQIPGVSTLRFTAGGIGTVNPNEADYSPPSPGLQSLVGTVNGINTSFNFPITTASGYVLAWDGLLRFPGIDYTISGSTISVIGQAPQQWAAMIGW